MCRSCRQSRRSFLRIAGSTLAGTLLAACARQQGPQPAEQGSGHASEVHWAYEGEGDPAHWSELLPEYAVCSSGKSQSPIDITSAAHHETLGEIVFNYQSIPLTLTNNTHTIQINATPGSTITVAGTSYELAQFHFHDPSEHTINGQHSPMELHLVHKSADGALAVVGVLMNQGAENAALAQFWNALPQKAGEVKLDTQFAVASLLPADRHYYTYQGSLTTPPCSEGVRWIVLKAPIEVSPAQVEAYAAILPRTARPVQLLNGRTIADF